MCGYGTAFTKNPVKMLMDLTKLSISGSARSPKDLYKYVLLKNCLVWKLKHIYVNS